MPLNKKSFNDLLDDVFDVLFRQNLGVNHAEPMFLKILFLLWENREIKNIFLELSIREILDPPDYGFTLTERPADFIDGDLICYIAHATGWSEFGDACEKRKSTAEYKKILPGSADFSDRVSAALEDDWEDQEFYVYFGNEKKALGHLSRLTVLDRNLVSVQLAEFLTKLANCFSAAELDLIGRFCAVEEYGLALQLLINFLVSKDLKFNDIAVFEKLRDLSRLMHLESQFNFLPVLN